MNVNLKRKSGRKRKTLGRPVELVLQPFQEFFTEEVYGGVVLLACAAAALLWANSGWAGSYHALWRTDVGISLGAWGFAGSLHFWINDGLMAVFFFAVGLELKRELLHGELASPKKATLPIAAALFYTGEISFVSLAVAALFLGGLLAVNSFGVHHLGVYALLGIGLWAAFLTSGVHPTVAGVIAARTVPVRPHGGFLLPFTRLF